MTGDAAEELAEWDDLAAEALLAHLCGGGLPATRYERSTTVQTGCARVTCRCTVETVMEHGRGAMACTVFETFFNDLSGRSVIQRVAGIEFDGNRRAAVLQTVHKFYEGVWPAIQRTVEVPAPYEGPAGGGFLLMRDTSKGGAGPFQWMAAAGPCMIQGNRSPEAAMRRILNGEHDYFMISDLLFGAAALCEPGRTHWGYAFLGRTPNGGQQIECLLDNRPWEPGEAMLSAAPFPATDRFPGYLTFWQFFMLRPVTPEWAALAERDLPTRG